MTDSSPGKYGAYLFVGGAVLGSLVAASTTALLVYVYNRSEEENEDLEQEIQNLHNMSKKQRKKSHRITTTNGNDNGDENMEILNGQINGGQILNNGITDSAYFPPAYCETLNNGDLHQKQIQIVQEKQISIWNQPVSTPPLYNKKNNTQTQKQLNQIKNAGKIGGAVKGGVPAVPFSKSPPSPANVTASTYSAGIPRTPTVDSAKMMVDQGAKIEEAAAHDEYCRIMTPEMQMSEEVEEVCLSLAECLELRDKWLFQPAITPQKMPDCEPAVFPSDVSPIPPEFIPLPPLNYHCQMEQGVVHVYSDGKLVYGPVGTSREFFTDMHQILKVQAFGPVKTYTHHRLMLLEQKFSMHMMLNADKEFLAQKTAPHRDFYNVRKVDTHIHHSACMHQKHLLRFIKAKLRCEPDEIVIFRDGKYLTVKEVFESLNLTSYDLNVDTLDMHVDKNTFHRFDRFNLKYNPCGQSRLREVFLKNDNVIHGRYLGELTKEVLKDLESNKYQHTEFRISIYGRKKVEWDILAQWISMYNLYSNNNVWLIQIPRLYNIYFSQGLLENFQQLLDNIFLPLFEVTLDPSTHPSLHVFLQNVVGFDSVDDESKPERRPTKTNPIPEEWNHQYNPAYSYYTYYLYSNLYVLNRLREQRGLNTFAYRPHCGESGDIDHLASAFLTAENIAHGCNLRKSPCLQYLYYIKQIGLCMSPLSNNSLFLNYHRNPFPQFFQVGLSVSLSSDDPLQIHLTREPLVEEYSVAAQVWKLSSADLCEIARNGVLHSGYPHACKKHWVGEEYWKMGPDGNDIKKTNVPNLRVRYRYDTLLSEMLLLQQGAAAHNARIQKINAAEQQES